MHEEQHVLPGRSVGATTMPVSEITTVAREWVVRHASSAPDFAGAYLYGGITTLPAHAPFPLYRDVDLIVVSRDETAATKPPQEVLYRGVMLEIGAGSLDHHQAPDQILADPSVGPN